MVGAVKKVEEAVIIRNVSFMVTDVIAVIADSVVSILSTPQDRRESTQQVLKNPLTQRYLLKMIKNDKRSIYHTYGLEIAENGIMVGIKPTRI